MLKCMSLITGTVSVMLNNVFITNLHLPVLVCMSSWLQLQNNHDYTDVFATVIVYIVL